MLSVSLVHSPPLRLRRFSVLDSGPRSFVLSLCFLSSLSFNMALASGIYTFFCLLMSILLPRQ